MSAAPLNLFLHKCRRCGKKEDKSRELHGVDVQECYPLYGSERAERARTRIWIGCVIIGTEDSSGMLNGTDSNRPQSRLRRDVFFRTDFEISEPIRTDRSTRGFKYNLPFGPKGAEIFHPRHPGQKSSAFSSLSNVVTSRARVHAATPPSTRD